MAHEHEQCGIHPSDKSRAPKLISPAPTRRTLSGADAIRSKTRMGFFERSLMAPHKGHAWLNQAVPPRPLPQARRRQEGEGTNASKPPRGRHSAFVFCKWRSAGRAE